MESGQRILNLVIADDDPDDQYLMQKAIWETNSNHKITAVYNGLQLMEYLLRSGMYKNCHDSRPDGIFLDLNMPLLSGTEAVKRIKKDPGLASLPIYILSTSKNIKEKNDLLSIGAKAFYTKTHEYNMLKQMIGEITGELCKIKK
jgi:two-component system response regulator